MTQWKIDIKDIPKESNYDGPPQATISILHNGTKIWDCIGHLILSNNPECKWALRELERYANIVEALLENKTLASQTKDKLK